MLSSAVLPTRCAPPKCRLPVGELRAHGAPASGIESYDPRSGGWRDGFTAQAKVEPAWPSAE